MRICPGCRTSYQENVQFCPKDGLPLIDRAITRSAPGEDDLHQTQDPDTAVNPGVMIGEYRVEGIIAEGGMGTIYAGIHPVISKRVAIKVLNKRYAEDPRAVSRFVMEARSVNEIGHHNIVDIFSIGELDDGRNYFIMEYLDGLGLHDVLYREGHLAPGVVLHIFEQLCDALTSTHGKGFVHRDLKPDNIVVLRRPPHPLIKILDFGLTKLRSGARLSNTEVGVVVGTPEYMAPEQCRGEPVDPRTDVYSMGVMLYELVTGFRPFTDPSPLRVITMQQLSAPIPPSHHLALSRDLERVILKAMAKNPDQRFQTAVEFFLGLSHAVPTRLPWRYSLAPLEEEAEQDATTPGPVKRISSVPMGLPPKPRVVEVPKPIAIVGELSEKELEALSSSPESPGSALRKVRESARKQGLMPDRPADAGAASNGTLIGTGPPLRPAAQLGRPESGELEGGAPTEISPPPEAVRLAARRAARLRADPDAADTTQPPDWDITEQPTEEIPLQPTEEIPLPPAEEPTQPPDEEPTQPPAEEPTQPTDEEPTQPLTGIVVDRLPAPPTGPQPFLPRDSRTTTEPMEPPSFIFEATEEPTDQAQLPQEEQPRQRMREPSNVVIPYRGVARKREADLPNPMRILLVLVGAAVIIIIVVLLVLRLGG